MHPILEAVTTVLIAIVGVAVIALIISPKAKTSEVIQSTASGFGNSLAVAMTPVTGENVDINTDYPTSGGFGGFSSGKYSFGSFS
jgi:hypothetical protein